MESDSSAEEDNLIDLKELAKKRKLLVEKSQPSTAYYRKRQLNLHDESRDGRACFESYQGDVDSDPDPDDEPILSPASKRAKICVLAKDSPKTENSDNPSLSSINTSDDYVAIIEPQLLEDDDSDGSVKPRIFARRVGCTRETMNEIREVDDFIESCGNWSPRLQKRDKESESPAVRKITSESKHTE